MQKELITSSEEQTLEWAKEFSSLLKKGDCVALIGNLGAGKTVVSRGISKALGYEGDVHSPSYALVHEYPNDPQIFHIDLYRLPDGADFEEIGVEYYGFSEGITLIEWPERLGELNVGINYYVEIEHISDTERKITIKTSL